MLTPRRVVALLMALSLPAIAPTGAAAQDALDPMARGPYTPVTQDPFKVGTVNLQEPNAGGGAPTGGAAAATVDVRGSLYYPGDRATGSPLIVLVHGNHGSCDSGSAPNCTVFKRNDRGYAYLGENLATWGYTVVSLDQDQLIFYQDGLARGMHQRRLLIASVLDAFDKANQEPLTADGNTIGGIFVGKLDLTRIGMMGHSRGGDAVTSFIDYNRERPAPGRRYPIRGVINLAGTDYERRTPYGVPYLSLLPLCDGDVSNLHAARNFERGQHFLADPFPKIQFAVHGTNHNWYNSVWAADGEDSNPNDAACSTSRENNIRLSGGKSVPNALGETGHFQLRRDTGANGGGTYTFNNRGSGDPELMGDQERVGLALMNSFFRRYVGGEVGFDAYMTGERPATGLPLLPETACPNQTISGVRGTTLTPEGVVGDRIPCAERIMTSYYPAAGEGLDVLRPESEDPLGTSALGTRITSSGFVNPYLENGGVSPIPATTGSGLDWCNPEPTHFTPSALGYAGLPTATKSCPLPAIAALGGQSGTRENSPINHSYGLQLAAAWVNPASISTRIPAANADVSRYKALAFGAAVNFFDPRNPERTPAALWNPAATTQDFSVVLTDRAGRVGTVSAANQRYGNALQPSVGDTTSKTHVVLNQVRVPLTDFAAQGVDLTRVASLELRFGESGKPATGSVQLADFRFQELVTGPTVLTDAFGERSTQAIDLLAETPRAPASDQLPDLLGIGGSTQPTKSSACADRTAPVTATTSQRLRTGKLVLRGTARDAGCGRVASVQVTLAKPVDNGACRFVTARGTLSKAMPCSSQVALVAKGTRAWSLRTKLAPGRYTVTVRAYDRRGNVSRARTTRLRA